MRKQRNDWVPAFLAQFQQAREDIKKWPQWMQDAAVVRSATFPRPPSTTRQSQSNGRS